MELPLWFILLIWLSQSFIFFAVCEDVQLRHRLEENMWHAVCCVCCGLPRDTTGDFPQQVRFSLELYLLNIAWVTCKFLLRSEIINYLITYRIIHTTLVLSMEVFEPFVGYYFFNILLMVLQALHIFWAGLILRMVYKFLKGKVRIREIMMSVSNF